MVGGGDRILGPVEAFKQLQERGHDALELAVVGGFARSLPIASNSSKSSTSSCWQRHRGIAARLLAVSPSSDDTTVARLTMARSRPISSANASAGADLPCTRRADEQQRSARGESVAGHAMRPRDGVRDLDPPRTPSRNALGQQQVVEGKLGVADVEQVGVVAGLWEGPQPVVRLAGRSQAWDAPTTRHPALGRRFGRGVRQEFVEQVSPRATCVIFAAWDGSRRVRRGTRQATWRLRTLPVLLTRTVTPSTSGWDVAVRHVAEHVDFQHVLAIDTADTDAVDIWMVADGGQKAILSALRMREIGSRPIRTQGTARRSARPAPPRAGWHT